MRKRFHRRSSPTVESPAPRPRGMTVVRRRASRLVGLARVRPAGLMRAHSETCAQKGRQICLSGHVRHGRSCAAGLTSDASCAVSARAGGCVVRTASPRRRPHWVDLRATSRSAPALHPEVEPSRSGKLVRRQAAMNSLKPRRPEGPVHRLTRLVRCGLTRVMRAALLLADNDFTPVIDGRSLYDRGRDVDGQVEQCLPPDAYEPSSAGVQASRTEGVAAPSLCSSIPRRLGNSAHNAPTVPYHSLRKT